MKVLIFGQLTDATAADEVYVDSPNDTEAIRQALLNEFPLLAEKKFVLAVNRKIIAEPVAVNEFDEIALLPPFSGG